MHPARLRAAAAGRRQGQRGGTGGQGQKRGRRSGGGHGDRCCLNFRRYWFISEWGRYIADGAYRPLIIATVDASENVTHVSIWMHVSWDGLSTQSKSGNRKRFWQGHIEAGASLAKQVLAAFEDAICMTCTDDGKPDSVGHYSATRRTSQQPTTGRTEQRERELPRRQRTARCLGRQ